MKNLKRLLGLMAISGFAFGFAGNVKAAIYEGRGTGTGNEKLQNFIDCINSNDNTSTCTLTKSQTVSSALNVKKNVAINLEKGVTLTINSAINVDNGAHLTINGNGGKIYNTNTTDARVVKAQPGANLVVRTATLESAATGSTASHDYKGVISVYGGNNQSDPATYVKINSDVTVKGPSGLIVYPNGWTSSGTTAYNVTVDLDGTFNTDLYTIQVNGTVKNTSLTNAPIININGGTYTSEGTVALYAAGASTWSIKKGTFTGKGAVEIKSGKVTIDDGKFVSTTAKNACDTDATLAKFTVGNSLNAYGSGAVITEYNDSGYIGKADLTINGGTFTGNCNGIYFYDIDGTTEKITVNKGDFAVPEDMAVMNRQGASAPSTFINGGTFKGDTSNFTSATNRALAANLSTQTINGVTRVGEGYNATIEIEEGKGTITSLVDSPVELLAGYTHKISDYVKAKAEAGYHVEYTVVGDDDTVYTVTNGEFKMPEQDVTITVKFVEGEEPTPVKPGTTEDNKPSKNPQTYDGILSYITLAISSLGALGFATKKVLF